MEVRHAKVEIERLHANADGPWRDGRVPDAITNFASLQTRRDRHQAGLAFHNWHQRRPVARRYLFRPLTRGKRWLDQVEVLSEKLRAEGHGDQGEQGDGFYCCFEEGRRFSWLSDGYAGGSFVGANVEFSHLF